MKCSLRRDPRTGDAYLAVSVRGRPLLLDPTTNKGTAFTASERRELGLEGLLPPAVSTMDQQLRRVQEAFRAKPNPLEQYIFLAALQDRNETLFYRLVHDHIDEMLPIVYTPTVGEACQQFSHIYRRARGLYLAYDARDHVERVLRHHAAASASVIVVTDGERILGLGDQGAGGMGIPIGKLCLYTLGAGVPPHQTLPVMLDVGTDNADRLNDPLYLGLRQRRVRGEAYQSFVDRFVAAVMAVAPGVVLQWEDFHKANALRQLERFRNQLCTFNDDIQGTAAVVLAGILAALRLTAQTLAAQRIVLAGAGASAQGIAGLFVAALQAEGLTATEARQRVWMVDRQGLVVTGRPDLVTFKAAFAREPAEVARYDCRDRSRLTLVDVIRNVRPTILLGCSGTPGIFDEPVVRAMAGVCERPVIFPLSNPTAKAECTPRDAWRWSEARAIVATGSPFPPLDLGGPPRRVGQCNNAFIFPGVGLGAITGGVRRITEGMFLAAARALAAMVTPMDLTVPAVYPELGRLRECSHAVACAVIRQAIAEGHAEAPRAEALEDRVRRAMWFPEYLPMRFEA